MKGLPYKHYFNVREDGKFVWDEPDMFEYKKSNLKGKRGYAIIEEEKEKPTPNQYAYYFGGIIRTECMASDTFKGYTERKIHQILFAELRSKTESILLPDGSYKQIQITEDFDRYKIDDMRLYIEELIPYLNQTYNIWPKPSEHYKYNKFHIDPKTYK